ncbi:MAG TPA: hypothetical protein VJS40_06550 [Aestuariivirgaceae bacterium]|nr:hypothetical protein [Aestuariivirgaceae bacterium]
MAATSDDLVSTFGFGCGSGTTLRGGSILATGAGSALAACGGGAGFSGAGFSDAAMAGLDLRADFFFFAAADDFFTHPILKVWQRIFEGVSGARVRMLSRVAAWAPRPQATADSNAKYCKPRRRDVRMQR